MPDFQPRSPGDPLALSASEINAWTEVARDFYRRRAGAVAGRPQAAPVRPADTILVRNDTGASLPEFSVLALSRGSQYDPLIPADDDPLGLQRRPVFAGVAPIGRDDPFVVTLEPLPAGAVGRAALDGMVVVEVAFGPPDPGASSTWRARPQSGVTLRLTAGCDGPAKIIWRAAGTGNAVCVVQLGPGHHAPLWCGNHYSVDPLPGLQTEQVVGFGSQKYGLYKVLGSVTPWDSDTFDCVPLPVVLLGGVTATVRPATVPAAHLPAYFGMRAAVWAFDRHDQPIGALTQFLPLVKGSLAAPGAGIDYGGDWFPEFTGGPNFGSRGDSYLGKVATAVKYPFLNQVFHVAGGHIAWVLKWSVSTAAGGHDDFWGGAAFVEGFSHLAHQDGTGGSDGGAGGTYFLFGSAGFCDCCSPAVPPFDNPLPPGASDPFPQSRPSAAPTADPDTREFTVGTSVTLAANPSGGRNAPAATYSGFTWYANRTPVAHTENPTIMFTESGEYLLEVFFVDDDPDGPVQGYGSYAVSVAPNPVRTVTTTATGLLTDRLVRADATGGAFGYELPDAAEFVSGDELTVLKVDGTGNAVTTSPKAGQTLNGSGVGIGRNTAYGVVRVRRVSATAWETTG